MQVGIHQVRLSELRLERRVPKVSLNMIDRVRQHGQITPVIVRRTNAAQFEILANTESWLCVQKAGMTAVEIVVREDLDDEQAADIINHSGNKMDPISEAQWFQECLDQGWQDRLFDTIHELARFVGVSRSYVAHALRLLTLDEDIQTMIRAGDLKVGHAKALLSLKNPKDQHRYVQRIRWGRWSVRRTELEIRQHRSGTNAQAQTKSVTTQALERKLTSTIGSAVTIDEHDGTLTIDYCQDLNVLDGLLQRLSNTPQ